MRKRYIFFFCYIFFFTAVPLCLYFFWPVNSGMEEMMTAGSLLSDTTQQGISDQGIKEMQDSQMQHDAMLALNNSFGNMNRALYTSYAEMICFVVSMLFAFIMSIMKLSVPEFKFGGLITAITIFNVLYLPAFGMLSIFLGPPFGMSSYVILMFLFSLNGIWIVLLILTMLTILFTILGVVKGKRREREKLMLMKQQTPQSSQHPQF